MRRVEGREVSKREDEEKDVRREWKEECDYLKERKLMKKLIEKWKENTNAKKLYIIIDVTRPSDNFSLKEKKKETLNKKKKNLSKYGTFQLVGQQHLLEPRD